MDTTTPAGKLLYHVIGALAEFERALLRERTMAGLAQAAANGKRGGRRPALTGKQRRQAREMLSDGATPTRVAAFFGVHRATIYRAASEAE